jgi:hypothetical protein
VPAPTIRAHSHRHSTFSNIRTIYSLTGTSCSLPSLASMSFCTCESGSHSAQTSFELP